MKREFRDLSEAVATTVGNTVKGYFAKFNSRSEDLGGFTEILLPGCFSESLKSNQDVMALVDHDTSKVLASKHSGTLKLHEDEIGLAFDFDLPDTSYARDLRALLEKNIIKSCSFGFSVPKGGDTWANEDGKYTRTVKKANLFEGTLTPFPAYKDTSAQLRSLFPDGMVTVPPVEDGTIVETTSKGEVRSKPTEKRYNKILSAVSGLKWAIVPEKLNVICGLLEARANGQSATKEEIRAAMDSLHEDAPFSNGGVAVIPVYGTITQRASMFSEFSGGTSCEAIGKAFDSALADDSVSSIVFDIDSPGGTVTGVPELGAKILSARGQKPTIAVANGMAGSAAYWIASAAEKIVCLPSASVGSIGVYTSHQDVSEALDKEGVKITFVSAGKYKVEGNPYQPLSEEAEANLQHEVSTYYDMFTQAVADGRGVPLDKVLSDFGQGRMLMAKDALAAGMVDQIATLEEVLAGLVVETPQEEVVVNNDNGVETTVQASEYQDDVCNCDCDECMDDNCDDCSNTSCTDPNCEHDLDDMDDDNGDAYSEAEWKETFALQIKMRQLAANL